MRRASSGTNCGPEGGELLRGLLALRLVGDGVDPPDLRGVNGITLYTSAASLYCAGDEGIKPSLLPPEFERVVNTTTGRHHSLQALAVNEMKVLDLRTKDSLQGRM